MVIAKWMGVTTMKYYLCDTIEDWIDKKINLALQNSDFCDDVHFDEIKSLKGYKKKDLIDIGCNLLCVGKKKINMLTNRVIGFVSYPLPYTEKIKTSTDTVWKEIGKNITPPSFYMINKKNYNYFRGEAEEFRKKIEIPIDKNVNALYICSKAEKDMDEYYRRIHLTYI